ncbi:MULTISPECIES: TadE family protein [unclassified Curtobacterium]|uniref:TadE family protein n=1 Tax=unclassified Curtobacterium TaxID=257496 RepID=UPI000DAA4F94|nr:MULTISPECIES: TadE family protein [unclassified Curtobacterium]PZE68158.1 hypothetical protein DEI83_04360 [Curtobacterium sp. MCBD17_021]WIB25453.1 pilus assembly protein [Curtobacterium sp. MCSS17_015]
MSDRACRRRPGERGSVTAEFAVTLPVVAVVLAAGIAGVLIVDGQGRLQSAAITAARAFGRGDDAAGRDALRTAAAGSVRVDRVRGMVCVHVGRAAGSGPFAGVGLRGDACSVDERADAGDEHADAAAGSPEGGRS